MVGNTQSTGSSANPSLAAIYMTTNGGTCWSPVIVQPYSTASLQAALGGCTSTTTCPVTAAAVALYNTPMPGALMGVASTGSGKYVWAVGAAPTASDGTLTTSSSATTALNYVEASWGTILFSANGGASWRANPATRCACAAPGATRILRCARAGRCRRRPRLRAGRTA